MFKKDDLESFTLFDPQKDDASKIVDAPGNYAILLRPGSKLPNDVIKIEYTPSTATYDGKEYEVIYVGISNESLHTRDYKKHFTGNNAGQSTLRKSIGSLMGLKKTYRSEGEKRKTNPKTKFIEDDEEKLSEWMHKHLLLLFQANRNCEMIEEEMIAALNPPLNIQKNYNSINITYRNALKGLRNDLSDMK